jgi:hypothetical protein
MEVALADSVVPTEQDAGAVAANLHGYCCVDSAAPYSAQPFCAGCIGSSRSPRPYAVMTNLRGLAAPAGGPLFLDALAALLWARCQWRQKGVYFPYTLCQS